MKIATWNVNSIRRRLPILLDWLADNKPDVLCLQETKVQDKDFPIDALASTGYNVTFRGRKSYNGVATLTRETPEYVLHGFLPGDDIEDDRVLQTVVRGIPILNTYVPQGFKITSEKYAFKLQWFERVRTVFQSALQTRETGDLARRYERSARANRRVSPGSPDQRCGFSHRRAQRI